MSIIREELKTGSIYIIDTLQFNLPALTSVFCWYDGEKGILMDAGTSDNTDAILSSLDRHGIPPGRLAGVVPSHYHFDHGGGCAELWWRMRGINPGFRIYTTPLTKHKLNGAGSHLRGAATTFGKFTGTMEQIPDEAFSLVEPGGCLPFEFNDRSQMMLLHTPGHIPDHCSPAVMNGGRCLFCFAAEACGTLYTGSNILSTPSSMPPNFSYSEYMTSLEKIRAFRPEAIGLCHFGILTGNDAERLFDEHSAFMSRFREAISEAFSENSSTVHVMKATAPLWDGRIDNSLLEMEGSGAFFGGLRLALTYGLMVDLGLREPKYEERFTQQ